MIARYDSQEAAKIIVVGVDHLTQSLDYVADSDTQVMVTYNGGIPVSHDTYLTAAEAANTEFGIIVYVSNKDSQFSYNLSYTVTVNAINDPDVTFDIVS